MRDVETPSAGEMAEEVLGLVTGLGIILLPMIILAVPGLVLLLPLLVLAVPVVAAGAVLAPAYLIVTRLLSRRR